MDDTARQLEDIYAIGRENLLPDEIAILDRRATGPADDERSQIVDVAHATDVLQRAIRGAEIDAGGG